MLKSRPKGNKKMKTPLKTKYSIQLTPPSHLEPTQSIKFTRVIGPPKISSERTLFGLLSC